MKKIYVLGISIMCLSLAFFAISLKKSSTMLNDSNVEALSESSGDPQITYRYPRRNGRADDCIIYSYFNINTNLSMTLLAPDDNQYSANLGWEKKEISALKDKCPIIFGQGCNPYTCQEIPY